MNQNYIHLIIFTEDILIPSFIKVEFHVAFCKTSVLFQVCGRFVSVVLLIHDTGMTQSFMVAGGYLKRNIILSMTSCCQVRSRNCTLVKHVPPTTLVAC